ncbi:hypothetical protein HYW83_05965 [Candidatus Peregrinibacteria bacterium]|nr:hypothetical protein [Candidatus Peregrinibacteria bacterium]
MFNTGQKLGWIGGIGFVLLIFGFYVGIKTVINFAAFEKYPSTSSGPLNFNLNYGQGGYGPREQDCMYPQLYYNADSTPRKATEEEKKMADEQKSACLSGVTEARDSAKVGDITQAIFGLVVGGGLFLLARRKTAA